MARLSEQGKSKFLELVVKATFQGRKEALEQQYAQLAESVYQSQGAKMVALLSDLPVGVLPVTTEVKCYFGGQSYTLYLPDRRPFTYSTFSNRFRFGVDDPQTIKFEELSRADSALDKEERELKNQIRALLSSCTTDKQLLAAWPEAAEYLPKGGIENLPAPCAENLNKLISELKSKA